MYMKQYWLFLSALISSISLIAQEPALWMRYPAISPDGKEIVFSYKGDLYKVSAEGGQAQLLTMHEAHDFMPVWSKDGKKIAFASDRYGNFDVFVMSSNGGEPTRITHHSAPDYPYDFTPDNQHIIFGSGRHTVHSNVRFPSPRLFLQLYKVPVGGGRSQLISATGMEHARFDSKGKMLVYQDRKGTEDAWRKRQTSSVARDIWTYDMTSQQYKRISSFEGEDRDPLFSSDDQSVYYLSEKKGPQNLFKLSLDGKTEKQITQFKDHPVRHLSRANDNTLCFSWNGEIYLVKNDGSPKKVNINVQADAKRNAETIVPVTATGGDVAVSPNGKEVAFIFRGEVFVTSVEGGITKRITNTPQQERDLAFSKDGRTLYYSAERGESWDIFRTSISRKEEPYFYASTLLKEEPVLVSDKEEFQPVISPDGKLMAYLEERNILKVYNLEKKTSVTIIGAGKNFSYRDGDQEYAWSPDSKWIVARSGKGRYGASEGVLYKADGTTPEGYDLTKSGFQDGGFQWALDGKAMLWVSDKWGRKSLAYQGSREVDIYMMFFDQDTYDRFRLSKEDYALLKEREDKVKKDSASKSRDSIAKANWKPDVESIDQRKIRLTPTSLSLGSYVMAPSGDKLWYTASNERTVELWQLDLRTRESRVITKLSGSNISLSPDGKWILLQSGGGIMKLEPESGRMTPISIRSEMVLNGAGEREYILHHAWRQVKKKFYDPKLHGLDWDMYRRNYAKFLPHINNNHDFQELLSEILGELNASHTGGRYSPQNPAGDQTASLGLFFDEFTVSKGLKITEVIAGGPVDVSISKIRAGHILEKIDGEEITADADWAGLLNRKAGKNVLLSLLNPTNNERYEESIKPIGSDQGLLYQRWVNTMREMVDKLSGGKLGYVHVQGMNDGSYRTVYEEVMGRNSEKEGLIVDTRFNGGGWLHDDLVTFLNGKQYLTFRPYGFQAGGGEPMNKWTKPSIVVMSESNYSDAFIFPYAYKQIGIGKLVGKPVPGTGTAVWWETQIDPTLVFGIPMIATVGKEGRPTENLQLYPDLDVDLPYEAFINKKDTQIEAAVKELLKEIGKK